MCICFVVYSCDVINRKDINSFVKKINVVGYFYPQQHISRRSHQHITCSTMQCYVKSIQNLVDFVISRSLH